MRDQAAARNVVGRHGGWRGDMIVITAVLVIGPDQQGVRPGLAVHYSMDDFGGEALTLADILRILLGVLAEVRVDDTEVWQVARIGVGEEFVDAADMHHVPRNSERVQACRELQVTLHRVSRALERSSER